MGATLLKPYIGWVIGNGQQIDFWRDTWVINIPIIEYIKLPRHLWIKCKTRLNNFISTHSWIPSDIRLLLLALGIDLQHIQCNANKKDGMVWKPDLHGEFTTKNAFDTFRRREDTTRW
ncbi:hypothetical protein GIB67_008657 [Kingdonia uniflora]|uniref:Uncharacterized protein n=1 Tax=Kingdonia uniflora TaxID=39325 RepID=A0A7J7M4Z4_9MAGN|nr:hypothetical protein GIB67_008657 [Kingdonia uniflora]